MNDYKNKHLGGSDKPTKPGLPQHAKAQNITKERILKNLPRGTSHSVTDEIMNVIHDMESDTGIVQEYMEEAFMSNMPILSEVRVGVSDYVNALKYCVLNKDMSNRNAWAIVFPDKMKRLEGMTDAKGVQGGNIDQSVARFNATKIVVALETQMRIHASIMYMPYNHEAMMVRVNLMRGNSANQGERVSPLVQLQAAEGVYADTKMPEDNTIELKMGMSDGAIESQNKLSDSIGRMAEAQMAKFAAGRSISEVQKLNIEYTDAVIDND